MPYNKVKEKDFSLWSFTEKERMVFVIAFLVSFIYGLVCTLCEIILNCLANKTWGMMAYELYQSAGPTGLSSMYISFVIVEGGNLMLIPVEKYRKIQYEEGREKGHIEGRDEGSQKTLIQVLELLEDGITDPERIRAALKNGAEE